MSDRLVDGSPRTIVEGRSCGPLGFGCWRFTHTDTDTARAALVAALDAGLTLVDTADVYGLDWGGHGFGTVEERLGDVLRADPSLRDRMVLATKGGIVPGVPYDSSPRSLRAAAEASLRRLHTDHIDLYQVHRPDPFTHPDAVADTLATLVDEGKVGAVGVSNHTPPQHRALAAALDDRGVGLATTQVEWSAACLDPFDDGTFDLAMADGLTVLGWSPLAGGRLTGRRGDPAPDGVRAELLDVLDDLADRFANDRSTVALAFALAHPSRPVVLVGTQDPARIAAATAALDVPLTRADAYRIIEASRGVPLP
jgi:aryl-alcohol dehydrogenase-like predicted oxidoreductase